MELLKTQKNQTKILGTILFLIAFTIAFFVIDPLEEKKHIKIKIRKCDIINPERNYKHSSNTKE